MIDILTDSDWAGDKIDRKSVSCVVTLIGGHCIRCQTATQTVPALSSGEADYVGNVKGGSVGIGMQSMARDFGDERVVRIATDSSASKGIASRLGLGKIRHLDTGLLWLQQDGWKRKSCRHWYQRSRGERHEANHGQTWLSGEDRETSKSVVYLWWCG